MPLRWTKRKCLYSFLCLCSVITWNFSSSPHEFKASNGVQWGYNQRSLHRYCSLRLFLQNFIRNWLQTSTDICKQLSSEAPCGVFWTPLVIPSYFVRISEPQHPVFSSFTENRLSDIDGGFPPDKPSIIRDYDYDCDSDLESIADEEIADEIARWDKTQRDDASSSESLPSSKEESLTGVVTISCDNSTVGSIAFRPPINASNSS